MSIHLSETAIPCTNGIVQLWGIRDVFDTYYPTKICAEAAARLWFPHEDVDQRYARIYFRTFIRDD